MSTDYRLTNKGLFMNTLRLLSVFILCMLPTLFANANFEMQTSPNSFSGLNQYKEGVVFPQFDSIQIIGAVATIDSRTKNQVEMNNKYKTIKFEKVVIENFSASLQKAVETELQSTLKLKLVDDFNANTLVIRPSVVGLDVGRWTDKLHAKPDQIVLNLEVFDVIKGGLLSTASMSFEILKKDIYYEHKNRGFKIKEKKLQKISEKIAANMSKMLVAMFEDIESIQAQN